MIVLVFLALATLFLAYSNGANDNFKGVATLYGSGTTNYRSSLALATAATFAGSIASLFIATALVKSFSGKGLVPETVAGSPEFLLAVAVGAGLTVILATLFGFPISTTHSLVGALVGAGLAFVGTAVNIGVLGTKFFLPLLLSPLIAAALAGTLYLILRSSRKALGITKESTLLVDIKSPDSSVKFSANRDAGLMHQPATADARTATYSGTVLGINSQRILDAVHFFSAAVVSFARGLNDTPKIVALVVAVEGLGLRYGLLGIGLAMALGGLINARRVAETMSKKITSLNPGQGVTANVVTGLLVVFASRFGLPVSTTHVSVGSLFGIGTVSREGNSRVIGEIFASWVLTLPIAAGLSALTAWIILGLAG